MTVQRSAARPPIVPGPKQDARTLATPVARISESPSQLGTVGRWSGLFQQKSQAACGARTFFCEDEGGVRIVAFLARRVQRVQRGSKRDSRGLRYFGRVELFGQEAASFFGTDGIPGLGCARLRRGGWP